MAFLPGLSAPSTFFILSEPLTAACNSTRFAGRELTTVTLTVGAGFAGFLPFAFWASAAAAAGAAGASDLAPADAVSALTAPAAIKPYNAPHASAADQVSLFILEISF